MNVSAGPPKAPVDKEAAARRKKADLWGAVWEASQFLSFDEIRQHVEGTLREIESDEP